MLLKKAFVNFWRNSLPLNKTERMTMLKIPSLVQFYWSFSKISIEFLRFWIWAEIFSQIFSSLDEKFSFLSLWLNGKNVFYSLSCTVEWCWIVWRMKWIRLDSETWFWPKFMHRTSEPNFVLQREEPNENIKTC